MKHGMTALLVALAMVVVACDGDDAELSTSSTIITGGTNAPGTSTTAAGGGGTSPPTTLVGEAVGGYEVVGEFPNDNGVQWYIVIPNGAYTDVDLFDFVFDLIESNPDLYGAEIFDNEDAVAAFVVVEADRTEEQVALLERHHFVTLEGRDRIVFRGPFSEFAGGAIGS